LLFLRFVGNEEPHRQIGEIFDVSESSVFRIIRRVADWIITLVPEYIVWPQGAEVQRVKEGFAELRGEMHDCMGAVDGSHIRIIKPMVENNREFFNCKDYPSINLTAIADAKKRFLMVTCGQVIDTMCEFFEKAISILPWKRTVSIFFLRVPL